MRLEVVGSNPSQMIFCVNILVQGAFRYRLFYPVPKARAFGTTFRVPITIMGTKGHFQPVPLAVSKGHFQLVPLTVFLVVSVNTVPGMPGDDMYVTSGHMNASCHRISVVSEKRKEDTTRPFLIHV